MIFALLSMAVIAYLFTFYLDADIGVVVCAFLILAPAISALLAGFTQGFGGKTVFADKWTIPMAVLLTLAILLMLLANRKKKEEEAE